MVLLLRFLGPSPGSHRCRLDALSFSLVSVIGVFLSFEEPRSRFIVEDIDGRLEIDTLSHFLFFG